MIVFIDGENYRQNLANILADNKDITNKDAIFKYDTTELLKEVLELENDMIDKVAKDVNDEAYMDSNIISGNAVGVVSKIGMKTEIGKIAEMVQEDDGETPLQVKVSKLGKIKKLKEHHA